MKRGFVYIGILLLFLLSGVTTLYAQTQTVKKVIKSTVNHLSSLDLTGDWQYEGVAVQFQSDNLLKKAGGKVASTKIEKEVDEQLSKIGFQPGVTRFTFNEDSTFTNTTNDRKMSGTYTYDANNKTITLKYLNHIPLKAHVSGSGGTISLLFEASGFLSMITFLGSHTGVSAVSSLSSILKSYEGMMIGMELRRLSN